MRLFHNRYQWDAGTMTAIKSLNWYVEGSDYNPQGITCIVAASEADALTIADREGFYIDSVTVKNNFQSLLDKKYTEYVKYIRSLEVAA